MKKILILLFALISFSLQAQWDTTAVGEIYTPAKVSVGVPPAFTAPRERLDVAGASAAFGSAATRLRIYQHAGSVSADANLVSGVINGASPYFAIETRLGNHPWVIVERLRIDHRGYVGIGTSMPEAKLEVRGGLKISDTDGGGHNLMVNNGYGGSFNTTQEYTYIAKFRGNVLGQTGPAYNALVITGGANGGNVGIGTDNPLARLHISGNNAALRLSSGSGAEYLNIYHDGTTGAHITSTAASGNAYNLFSYGKEHVFKNWRNSAWQESVRITDDGYVGIGTPAPDAMLTVKGGIHAEEVVLDLEVPDVPDYVFEKDYNLLPLSEIEGYVQANKHLPEVPSAREMAEKGLDVKEMNLLLLKKVEELTLHLIEMNTRLLKVEQENQELRAIAEKEKR